MHSRISTVRYGTILLKKYMDIGDKSTLVKIARLGKVLGR